MILEDTLFACIKGMSNSLMCGQRDVHQEICGHHMNGRMIAKMILMIGYYWTTTKVDYVSLGMTSHRC
jgi:hypothetical protein